MSLHVKKAWEDLVLELLRGPRIKEFNLLKTDGERFKFCKYILRNNPVALEIIEQIQKVLNSRDTLKARSTGHIREYLRVSEDHLRRRDFKKTVISLSLAIQEILLNNLDNCNPLSPQSGMFCESGSTESNDDNIGIVSLYTRRAEVLFQAQEYKACLNDIEEATSLMSTGCQCKIGQSSEGLSEKIVSCQSAFEWYWCFAGCTNVTGGLHSKIANGSQLLEINCTSSQGRFLKASDDIRAGDTLISESPYAAVLLPENALTHCACCFQALVAPFRCHHCCEVLYCSPSCREKAWVQYHKVECSLGPLLKMMDTSFQLSLRILLVTGANKILDFLKRCSSGSPSGESTNKTMLSGCTPQGGYLGDYRSVFSLVTNTDLQPVKTLMSLALHSALLAEFVGGVMVMDDNGVDDELQRPSKCDDCVKNRLSHSPDQEHERLEQGRMSSNFQKLFCSNLQQELECSNESSGGPSCLSTDVVGCLLFHHSQQMSCNVHAITAIVSASDDRASHRHPTSKEQVITREQKRIASAVYPTASLLNHACDPDVIVSFVGGHLIVRATHNISKGAEISHCYGPHVSRMGREDRQKLLYQQYFFTCQCKACKSDEELENKRLCFSAFACPKCQSAMKLSSLSDGIVGSCQNRDCTYEKNMSDECKLAQEADLLFVKGVRLSERVGAKEAIDVFKECLRRRKMLLHMYHKDLAETQDAIARCYAMIGDFKKASYYCALSSESVEKTFGSSSVEYAHELHKLSQLLFNDRQFKKALSTIDKASSLLMRHYGRNNPDVEELNEMKCCLMSFGARSRISKS
ncbi:PREDICTED: LOW QUALITY PROTEIN: SET and MYND domain-containing protein 4-like [Acropora digitifera]|uniref:LOW QUALITY PROTEIN: SET and MYND domain-containing protein 4-like n=1 Tax=Acropora digitifera TaxID=70779 RepID=UPI00077A103F|nr:PREDICTED: LOW QUALITY PROTEIN: SET and MYND domain-containing protein 4-like [Acropora digitifera]